MNTAEFIKLARDQVGKPYVLGAEASMTDPDPKAFDCSELVQWLYYQAGVKNPTFTDGAWLQYKATTAVTSPRTGDLVFLRNNPARDNGIGHVGIITAKKSNGDWEVVEAKGRAYGVVRSTLSYWKTRAYYAGIRRTSRLKLTDPIIIPPTPEVPSVPPETTSPLLKSGASGESVKELQALLDRNGLDVINDSQFGPQTELAVKSFQSQRELPITGAVDQATWDALRGAVAVRLKMPQVRRGSTGDAVKTLQGALNSILPSALVVDGDFGSGTETAVKKFQTAANLTADGIVGPNTWLWLGYK